MKHLVMTVQCTNPRCTGEKPVDIKFAEIAKGVIGVPEPRCSICGFVMERLGEKHEG